MLSGLITLRNKEQAAKRKQRPVRAGRIGLGELPAVYVQKGGLPVLPEALAQALKRRSQGRAFHPFQDRILPGQEVVINRLPYLDRAAETVERLGVPAGSL